MRIILVFFLALLSHTVVSGQIKDCLLNIGGIDNNTIIQVFQLNDVQRDKLEQWSGELLVEREKSEDKIVVLFDTHPQNTTEDLEKLASKYAVIKDEYVQITINFDQKLISLFNERQYERYLMLCSEAMRRPITRLSQLPEE